VCVSSIFDGVGEYETKAGFTASSKKQQWRETPQQHNYFDSTLVQPKPEPQKQGNPTAESL